MPKNLIDATLYVGVVSVHIQVDWPKVVRDAVRTTKDDDQDGAS